MFSINVARDPNSPARRDDKNFHSPVSRTPRKGRREWSGWGARSAGNPSAPPTGLYCPDPARSPGESRVPDAATLGAPALPCKDHLTSKQAFQSLLPSAAAKGAQPDSPARNHMVFRRRKSRRKTPSSQYWKFMCVVFRKGEGTMCENVAKQKILFMQARSHMGSFIQTKSPTILNAVLKSKHTKYQSFQKPEEHEEYLGGP